MKLLTIVRLSSAGFVCLASLCVILGWILEKNEAISVAEGFEPMQFSTALCLFSIGLSFLMINRPGLSRFFSAISFSIAVLSVLAFFGAPTGFLDSVFTPPESMETSEATSRMAPNSAVALIFIALALLVNGMTKIPNRLAFSSLLASCGSVFGVVAAAGYVFGYEPAYGWGEMNRMAIYTSILIGGVGAGLGIYQWRRSFDAMGVAPDWSAAMAFIVCMTFFVLMYQASVDREINVQKTLTEKAGNHFQDVISSRIASRGESLFRIAGRWAMWPEMTQKFWNEDTAQHVQDFPDLDAIGRTDAQGKIISIRARQKSNYAQAKDIKKVSDAIREKRFFTKNNRGFTLTESFVIGGRVSFAIMAPVSRNSQIKGAVFGVFDVIDFFRFNSKDGEVLKEYNFAISDDERLLYQRDLSDQGIVQKVSIVFPIFFGSQHWRLEVFPKASYVSDRRADLAVIGIFGGFSVSSLFALLVYLVQLFLMQKGEAIATSRRLQAILDGSTRVSIITTDQDGYVTSFNLGAERMLGYTFAEVKGKHAKLFHLEEELLLNQQEVYDEIKLEISEFGALTYKARLGEYEERNWRYVKKSGGIVPVNLIVTAIRGEEGITGYVQIAVDVTSTERQLRVYANRLERSNQDLEEFSYVASHDLKEPVRNLISYSRLLEEDLGKDLNPDAKADLGFIIEAANRMRTLVDDLLNLSRAGRSAFVKQEFHLKEAIDGAKYNLATLIAEKEAEITLGNDLPTIIADKGQLIQLFSNLICNALKFVANGVKPRVEITCSEHDVEWIIRVKDNGIGLKPEYAEQIFQPFKRLHGMTKYQGTGIGLAICRKIAERHDGRIWVESKPSAGTSFFLSLPKE